MIGEMTMKVDNKIFEKIITDEMKWCRSKEGRMATGYNAKERRIFIDGLWQARRLIRTYAKTFRKPNNEADASSLRDSVRPLVLSDSEK